MSKYRLPALDLKTGINSSPHLVILGAGASIEACPGGDSMGRSVPDMKSIVDKLGLHQLIQSHGLNSRIDNFEKFYDALSSQGNNPALVKEIEDAIYSYFSSLSLPDKPTIYDYLLLSLRSKDLVASFNWDPFLAQAYQRNMRIVEPPRMVYLHGNVAIGVCLADHVVGFSNHLCNKCGKAFTRVPLLYPVKRKDYSKDLFISNEWDVLKSFLSQAYFLTIFGYSAPVTDAEAKRLMLGVWRNNPTRELYQIEVIDIKERKELEATWNPFFTRDHYSTSSDAFDSWILRYPRRSCESFAMATLMNSPWSENRFPKFSHLDQLHRWIEPLLNEEKRGAFTGTPCPTILD